MFPGTCPFHGQCPHRQALKQPFDSIAVTIIFAVEHQLDMEVSVANMTDHRTEQTAVFNISLGIGDTFR